MPGLHQKYIGTLYTKNAYSQQVLRQSRPRMGPSRSMPHQALWSQVATAVAEMERLCLSALHTSAYFLNSRPASPPRHAQTMSAS